MEIEGRPLYGEMALKNEQKWGRLSTVYSVWSDEMHVCVTECIQIMDMHQKHQKYDKKYEWYRNRLILHFWS